VTIERADFDTITEQDLRELVEAQVPEGLRLDFKLTQYGNSDSDKRELLKDISAFANTQGGHLLIGVEETGGVATALTGIDIDTDKEILRMEQILRSGLTPPLSNLRIRTIPLASEQKVLLLRVPRSWNPPHRVSAGDVNRFYIRHSAGVHEASMEELRALFSQSASALEQARRFRDERVRLVCDGRGPRPLEGNGRFFLHIVPVAAFSGMVHLDMQQVPTRINAFGLLGVQLGMTPRYNYYGCINEMGGNESGGYTQVFRNGALEATMAGIVMEGQTGRHYVYALDLEMYIFQKLSSYIMGLRDLGVPPPLIIMFTLEGVQGAYYAVARSYLPRSESPLPEPILALPECVMEDYGTNSDHERAVRPAFDALWNAAGYSECQFFNEDGVWDGKWHPS